MELSVVEVCASSAASGVVANKERCAIQSQIPIEEVSDFRLAHSCHLCHLCERQIKATHSVVLVLSGQFVSLDVLYGHVRGNTCLRGRGSFALQCSKLQQELTVLLLPTMDCNVRFASFGLRTNKLAHWRRLWTDLTSPSASFLLGVISAKRSF